MQKSMRKLLSLLLTLAMLLSMPLTVMAEEAVVSEETLPIVEEVAASETTESAELPSVEVPVTEEVVIEEVLVEEVPAVEEAPVVEAVVSAPVAVLAAVEEEAELFSAFSAQVGTYDAETETYAYGETVYTTFAEAMAAAELMAATDTTADVAVDIAGEDTLTAGLSVSGNVRVVVNADATLTAASEVVIDGGSNERTGSGAFFMVYAGTLTLENVSIKNMTRGATGSGAAINVQGGATATVTNGTFSGNTAQSGGALYNAGTLTLTDVTVTGNSAGGNGGAVFVGSDDTLTVVDGSFEGNEAAGSTGGGAIYAAAGSSVTVTGTAFEENKVTGSGGGGAINTRGTLTMTNAAFTENQSVNKSGGALYIYKSAAKVIATGCTFTGNVANNSGGAAYSDAIPDGESSFVQQDYTNCSFTNNVATTGSGGAICASWSNVKAQTIVEGCTFTGNTAPASTRASGVACGNIEWIDSKFVAPYTSLSSGMGDIRYATSCAVTASGTADLGVIKNGNKLTVEAASDKVTEITVAENSADITVTLSFEDLGSYDYTVTVNDVPQELTDSAFTLAAGTEKSVIKATPTPKAVLSVAQVGDDVFTTLEAAVEAANALDANTNVILLNDITYTQPTTIELGGKVRLYVAGGEQVTISGPLTLTGKEDATRYVAYITGAGSKLTLDGVTIDGYSRAAEGTYGALRVEKEAELVLNNVTARNVQACRGVVYVTSTGTKFTATNCTFEDNSAIFEYGGVISTYAAPIVTLTGCTFKGNTSATYGGAFATLNSAADGKYGAVVTMTDCVFENNTSGTAGGAVRLARATATLTNCSFTGNTAGSFGDDICISGSQMALTLAGTTSAADLEIYDDEAVTITIAEGATGAIDLSFTTQTMHAKYYADAETPLPLFAGDGFAAAYAAGKLTLENEAYELLSTGYLAFKGIASVNGVYFPTITDAINSITTEGTVVVADTGADITEEIFTMPGVTLDLNGQTVISTYPIIYNGSHIIDSSDGEGKLVCAKDALVVPTDNKALPVWVDEPDTGVDYYCFTALETINTKGSTAGGTYTYITRPEFNEDIAAMLGADGAAAHGLKVKILLKWDDSANTGYTEELPLVYSEDDVKAVYADNKAFYAYVTNYANYVDKSLEISVQVVSDTGVTFTVPATAIQE